MFAGILSQELENTSQTRVFTVNPGGTRTKMRAEAMPGENPSTLPALHPTCGYNQFMTFSYLHKYAKSMAPTEQLGAIL